MQYYFQAFPDPPHGHKLTQAHPGSHERRELAVPPPCHSCSHSRGCSGAHQNLLQALREREASPEAAGSWEQGGLEAGLPP